MVSARKNKWIVISVLAGLLVLTVAALSLILTRCSADSKKDAGQTDTTAGAAELAVYIPGEYPEGFIFADTAYDEDMSEEEIFAAYDHDNDPAHPVLDVKVELGISNIGSRPGIPRPDPAPEEYPSVTPAQDIQPAATPAPTPVPEPSVTIVPGIIVPHVDLPLDMPDIDLPVLYITNPDIPTPQFTGDACTIEWKYTAGRDALFSISISCDGGQNFAGLASGIDGDSYELTMPDMTGDECVIRVTAFVGTIEYAYADTDKFSLVPSPEPTPALVENYIDPQVEYTALPGVRINRQIDGPVWFIADNHAQDAESFVWQLSKVPFWGTSESFGDDAGVVAAGEVDISQTGEFPIDLNSICDNLVEPDTSGEQDSSSASDAPILLEQPIYQFYIRVVALDKNGKCIGDPGRGLSFSYGEPDVISNLDSAAADESSEIGLLINMPYYNKWEWRRVAPDVLNRDLASSPDMVLFEGKDESPTASAIIQKAVQVELQVSTVPFTKNDTESLIKPQGLVYSDMDSAPDILDSVSGYYYMTPWFHGIEYKKFVPAKEELDTMGGIYYYVRAVFYVPDDENPSVLRPMPSETLTIAFRVTSAAKNEVKQVTVDSNIPFTQFLRYVPIQWQHPNYDEYFEVTRHIEAEEMNFSIKNTKTGEFLLPYAFHCETYGWTREQYQAQLDKMLPPGSSFHYLKSEPGFWDEFFSLLNAIYSSVQEAYADAKAVVIDVVVNYLPIGEDARGYMRKAVSYALDYGLVYIGIPPSLPNIDELAAGGMDYCMEYAVAEVLKEAGIPADSAAAEELSDEVRQQVRETVAEEIRNAMLARKQNPFKVDFLRISTDMLYEPAFIDVMVVNYSDTEYSVPGTLYLNFGNGFDVYRGNCLYIPALKPGDLTVIRVYLDHTRNQYDGYGKYFDEKYYGKSEFPVEMRLYTSYMLPDIKAAAAEQGLSPVPLPYVTEYVYDRKDYSYIRDFVPAEIIWDSDDSVDPFEFMD